MPRYRFNWSNLSSGLLAGLGSALDVDEPYDDGLRAYYGARPKPDFVFDAWDVLREQWLAEDAQSLAWVASDLRDRRVGAVDESDDLEYLRGLRRSAGMREVVHAYFVALGEEPAPDSPAVRSGDQMVRLSVETAAALDASKDPGRVQESVSDGGAEQADEAGTLTPSPTPGRNAPGEVFSGGEPLRSFVERSLVASFGEGIFSVDQDGDFAGQQGSAGVYVRPSEDPFAVRIFSIVLKDFDVRPDLFEKINVINQQLRIGKLVFVENLLLLDHWLIAEHLSTVELGIAILNLSQAADDLDNVVQQEFGGRTMFVERATDEIDV